MPQQPLSLEAVDALMLPDLPLMEDVVSLHHRVQVFDKLDTTNEEALRQLAAGPVEDGTYLIANTQTDGTDRKRDTFYSPADTGLYVSLIRNDPEVLDPASLSKLTLAASVATAEAIEESVGVCPKIKWTNDLYYRDRKVCGIRAESFPAGAERPAAVVVGVGINCFTKHFPEDLRETAGALTTGSIDFIDRNRLAVVLYDRLRYWTDRLDDPQLLREYRSRAYLTGKEILFVRNGTSYRGIVHDIDEDGRLLIELTSALIPKSSEQLIALDPGEVSVTSWNEPEES